MPDRRERILAPLGDLTRVGLEIGALHHPIVEPANADANVLYVDHADTARSIEPWAASPYVQLGLLAQVQGDYTGASGRLSEAIHREDRNWLLYYLRSKVEHEAGNLAAAQSDLRRAQGLNPLEDCLRQGWDGCG